MSLLLALPLLVLAADESGEISDSEKQVQMAYRLCEMFDNTGLSSECEVGGLSIDVTLDMNSGEARGLCPTLVKMLNERNDAFKGSDWKIRIFSPYGERPIASCRIK
ncbi:hypothetical protein [Geminicoccus flavidas]|uniref:hypothetical protein n=1 Tax=Geminicoccus flavidas TaxID=2506407 RepID=UPI00135A6E2E|nr:hypothetical protein [Geminicoccus flavidas]